MQPSDDQRLFFGPNFAALNGDVGGLLESQASENRILKQKLESKAQALLILSKELERLREESKDYKELTDRLQQTGGGGVSSEWRLLRSNSVRDKVATRQFGQLRDENRKLLVERERLRGLLSDREEDVRALRDELGRDRDERRREEAERRRRERNAEQAGEVLDRMEQLQDKYARMRQDLQSLLDEKEDLVQERDAYKCKVHRLNHAMTALLKTDGYKSVDLDWIVAENRFLRETLDQLQDEKQLANDMGKRYKAALENVRKPVKLPGGGQSGSLSEEDKQTVEKIAGLLSKSSFPCPPQLDLSSPTSLRELCMSLLETLNDRMTQLKHQRSANKHIVERLTKLEEKMKDLKNGDLILAPSQFLMQGYSNANVDDDSKQQQQQQHHPEESLLNQVRERLSSTASTGFAFKLEREPESAEPSPDLADLYRKFEALSSDGASSSSGMPSLEPEMAAASTAKTRLDPPDLIAQGMPRLVTDRGEDKLIVEVEQKVEEKEEEGPVVLPPHLQNLVDSAMRDLLAEAQ